MADLEYKYAVYIDDEGKAHRIYASSIQDTAGYEAAVNLSTEFGLLDPSEQFPIVPRLGGTAKRNHFTALGEPSVRTVFSGEAENDKTHDARVFALLEQLTKSAHFVVEGILTQRQQRSFQLLRKLYEYQWGAEVHRIVSEEAVIRHDLFGQPTEIEMSIHRPWVAIEVIHTHFPEDVAFQGMVSVSRAMPLMVLFDCTDVQDYFLRVLPEQNRIETRLYMLGGEVYLENNKLGIASAAGLRAEVMAAIRRRKDSLKWRDSHSSRVGSK